MPASWKGYISFGLVSVPISLSPAARSEHISFNQLHNVCHTRLKHPLFCPTCNRNVEWSEIEKGYEYEKEQYLLFTPQELKSIEPSTAEAMEILEFVKLGEIDPIYFDQSYYIAPQDAGVHAYHLLQNAMRESGYAGIAKVTMHNREYIVVIRATDTGMTLHTMFYSNEIREAKEFGNKDKGEVREQEKTLALQLIKNLAGPFEPEKYKDTYQEALQNLIDAKSHGRAVPAVQHKTKAPVIDLVAALKQSVEQQSARKSGKTLLRAVPAAKTEERKKGRKVS
jgi:DNA end-binding protein Ku